MRAGIYNLNCEQGSTFARTIELQFPDLEADPTGNTFADLSIEGFSARMQVRRTIESDSFMLELTTENLGLIINPIEGQINVLEIFAEDSVTASIAHSGVYDLEIISTDGIVSRILQGAFELSLEVTR